MNERLVRIETKLDQALSNHTDHEERIRALERARWPLPSLALLVAAAGVVVGFVS